MKRTFRNGGIRSGKTTEFERRRQLLSSDRDTILGQSIETLRLSVRARRTLQKLGVSLIFDLIGKTEEELIATKNFGQTSLNEVKKKLEEIGLSLAGRSFGLTAHPGRIEIVQTDANGLPSKSCIYAAHVSAVLDASEDGKFGSLVCLDGAMQARVRVPYQSLIAALDAARRLDQ